MATWDCGALALPDPLLYPYGYSIACLFPNGLSDIGFYWQHVSAIPLAINELRNGWPLIVPRTFTRPRVRKNLTDSSHTM